MMRERGADFAALGLALVTVAVFSAGAGGAVFDSAPLTQFAASAPGSTPITVIITTGFELQLGDVAVGTPVVTPVTLQNSSGQVLGYRIALQSPVGHFFWHYQGCPAGIPADGSCTISVRFTPEAEGSVGASLVVTPFLDGSQAPHSVSTPMIFQATGETSLNLLCPTIGLTTNPIAFAGTLLPAASGSDVTLTVTPAGGTSVTGTVMTGPLGHFRARYLPSAAGVWTAQAQFGGDAARGTATSASCTITVSVGGWVSVTLKSFTGAFVHVISVKIGKVALHFRVLSRSEITARVPHGVPFETATDKAVDPTVTTSSGVVPVQTASWQSTTGGITASDDWYAKT